MNAGWLFWQPSSEATVVVVASKSSIGNRLRGRSAQELHLRPSLGDDPSQVRSGVFPKWPKPADCRMPRRRERVVPLEGQPDGAGPRFAA